MTPPAVRPDRTLIAILSIIAAIVVIALVVVFTRGGTVDVDPTTPEGVVQSYARAVIAHDRTAALDLLASDLRENCDRAEPSNVMDLRMTVVSSTISGDTALVQVTISHGTGSGLFGDSNYTYDETFTLVLENSEWKVHYTPWEFMLCFNQGKY